LPYVTAAATSESDAAAMAERLHEIMDAPQTAALTRGVDGLSTPDVDAYERVMAVEREAVELGFPETE
jgi:hypothetical protein